MLPSRWRQKLERFERVWGSAREGRALKDAEAAAREEVTKGAIDGQRQLLEAMRDRAERLAVEEHMALLLEQLNSMATDFILQMQEEGWAQGSWGLQRVLQLPPTQTQLQTVHAPDVWIQPGAEFVEVQPGPPPPTLIAVAPYLMQEQIRAVTAQNGSGLALCYRALECIFRHQGVALTLHARRQDQLAGRSDETEMIARMCPAEQHFWQHPLAAMMVWALRRRHRIAADLLSLVPGWVPHPRYQALIALSRYLDGGPATGPRAVRFRQGVAYKCSRGAEYAKVHDPELFRHTGFVFCDDSATALSHHPIRSARAFVELQFSDEDPGHVVRNVGLKVAVGVVPFAGCEHSYLFGRQNAVTYQNTGDVSYGFQVSGSEATDQKWGSGSRVGILLDMGSRPRNVEFYRDGRPVWRYEGLPHEEYYFAASFLCKVPRCSFRIVNSFYPC